jgi:predicted GNAT family acetyltransferase
MSDYSVRDNPDRNRIEVEVEGRLAVIDYWRSGDTIYYVHTGVPEELEGRGIASQMARFALELAREQGLKVVPRCPFVAAYIKRHPEYQDLVA